MNSEVLIIGGGVIGLSIARGLHKRGIKRITLLESGMAGRESSFAAAGILAPQAEADHADDFFNFCDESNRLYPQFAEQLLDETGVDIQLDLSGTYYLAFSEADSAEIRRRFEWQNTAGLRVEQLSAEEIRKAEPLVSTTVREGLFFPDDRQVDNRKLLDALRKYADVNGITILEDTRVTDLTVSGGKVMQVHAVGQSFSAELVVLATGAWTSVIKTGGDFLSRLGIRPIRGQMISYQPDRRWFDKVIYSPRGYIVPRRSGKLLAGATVEDAGFDDRVTEDGIADVRRNALEIAPGLIDLEPAETWSGLRPFAELDGLPVLGAIPEAANLFVAAAHYRNGILLCPLTANIVAGKIAENLNSKYLDIFSVRRFDLSEISAVGGAQTAI